MTDWNKLKVVDLKTELKKRGLAQTGLKPVLVARLTAAENEDGSESEATLQGDAGRADVTTSSDTVSPIQTTSDRSTEVLTDAPLQSTPNSKLEPSTHVTESNSGAQETSNLDPQTAPPSTQSTTIIELSQPPAQTQDGHQSTLPSAEPQEILDDRQKRKRRSQSPPPSTTDSARKRARQDEALEINTEIITSKEDATWVEKHNAVDSAEVNADAMEVAPAGEGVEPVPTIVDVAKEEIQIQDVPGANTDERLPLPQDMELDGKQTPDLGQDQESPSRVKDSRFKGLFPSQQNGPSLDQSSSRDAGFDAMDVDTERDISPALHPATSALYIRDFMRPLNPAQLKSYLTTLATPPGQEPDPDSIVNFYLDPIRTHAFVSLTSVSAAARVRSAIHDRIWPDERTRKPLWVDFAPAEKVEQWIEEEQSTSSGGRASQKKWEVQYDVDEDRNVTATLQESHNFPRGPAIRQPSLPVPFPSPRIPSKPRGIDGAPTGPRSTQVQYSRIANSFSTLDQLLKSTTAKPVLYYKPVSKELADKRLDNIDLAMSKTPFVGPAGSEINRYTFEDSDVLVDRGPEIFPGIRPPPGFRGPSFPDGSRPGGPRGGGGGYRGHRSAFGGGFRDRGYDSYRGGRRDGRDERRY